MTDELDTRLKAAIAIGEEAGRLARKLYDSRTPGTFEMKGHQDFLTEADGQVEKLIRSRIAAAFPTDTMLGEEGGGEVSARTWIVDPIDGTANFARAVPHWCISIGFALDGQPAVGVIVDPMHGETFAAKKGGGATLNGKPIRVAPTSDMRAASMELGWSSRLPFDGYVDMVRRVMSTGAVAKRAASGSLGLAYVACGRTDGYAELHINSWDVAAGLVLVAEAGGIVSDFFAGEGMRKGNPILVCTPALKDAFVKATGIKA